MMSRMKREKFENIVLDIMWKSLNVGDEKKVLKFTSRQIASYVNEMTEFAVLTTTEVAKRLEGSDYIDSEGIYHNLRWKLKDDLDRFDIIKIMLRNEMEMLK